MNFCESCNIACNDERAVDGEDFCLAGRVERAFGNTLKEHLQNENIDCVLMPYGAGVRARFALPLESYLIYVRYKNLEYVRQIISDTNA